MSKLDLSRLVMNQATTRAMWNHRQSLEGYARHGISQVSLWRDKVQELGALETRKLLNDLNMHVSGLNRIGPVFDANGQVSEIYLEDAKRGIEEAHILEADTLMFFSGTSLPGDNDIGLARQRVREALEMTLPLARQAKVGLVIEPLHPMLAGDRSCINTMKQSNDICDAVGVGLGIIVDVYHVWWDPDLEAQIARAGPDRLQGFHINDWLVPTTDFLTDRGMMGDGVIEIQKIRQWMEQAGYTGAVEIEIFSERWWQEQPDTVVENAIKKSLEGA